MSAWAEQCGRCGGYFDCDEINAAGHCGHCRRMAAIEAIDAVNAVRAVEALCPPPTPDTKHEG